MRRGGRLVLLLGIVVAAAVALLFLLFVVPQPQPQPISAQPTEVPRRQVIVARIDIPINTVLSDTETFLISDDIPETEYARNPRQYFTNVLELQNKLTLRPIGAGQPILASDVTEAGLSLQIPPAQGDEPRPKAVAFEVNSLTGVADQIKPGDFVDVIGSFRITRTFLRPGFNEEGAVTIREEQIPDLQTTKTLVQNVQVLRILKPQLPPSGTGTPGAEQPQQQQQPQAQPQTDASGRPVQQGQAGAAATPTGDTFQPGNWLLILAVTDQEAEIVKFALEQGIGITLVLRGRGDTAVEETLGATLDLLISRFGLPLPEPLPPAVGSPDQLTPLPTVAVPAGTPTATPATP